MAHKYFLIPYRDILTQAQNFDIVTSGSDYVWVNEITGLVQSGSGQVLPYITKYVPMKICEAIEATQDHEDIVVAAKEAWNTEFPDNQIPEACVLSFDVGNADMEGQRINYVGYLIGLLP